MTDIACMVLTVTVAILICYLGYCFGNLRMLTKVRKWLDVLDDDYDRLRDVALELVALLERMEDASPCVDWCEHAEGCEEAGVCWYEHQIGE